jgi:hypothetical protein
MFLTFIQSFSNFRAQMNRVPDESNVHWYIIMKMSLKMQQRFASRYSCLGGRTNEKILLKSQKSYCKCALGNRAVAK